MTQMLKIFPATEQDAQYIIDNIYEADEAEIAAHGCSVAYAVKFSFHHADQVWAALAPEGPVCIWGVSKSKSLIGANTAFLLTSKLIDKYSLPFARCARTMVDKFCEEFGTVEQYVDSRHHRALRFYRWLGFEVDDGILLGANRVPMNKICYRGSAWAG